MSEPGLNPAYLSDPGLFAAQLQAQQQAAIAELLMKQGLTPMGDQSPSVGGVAGRVHPMQGIAKIAALLSGQSMLGQSNDTSQAVMQRQMAALGPMLQAQQAQQGPQAPAGGGQSIMAGAGPVPASMSAPNNPTMGGAPPPPPPQGPPPPMGSAGSLAIPGFTTAENWNSYLTDPKAHLKAMVEAAALTPEMKQLASLYGYGSQQYQAGLAGLVKKAMTQQNRPGGSSTDLSTGRTTYFPGMPSPGAVYSQNPDGSFRQDMAQNSAAVIRESAGAHQAGEGDATPFATYTKEGQPNKIVSRTAASGYTTPAPAAGPGGGSNFTMQGNAAAARAEIARDTSNPNLAATLAAFDAKYGTSAPPAASSGGGFYGAPPPGTAAGADKGATDAQESWNQNHSAAMVAPRGIALMDGIDQLAEKTLVGPGASKLQFFNGLFSMLTGKEASGNSAQDYQTMKKLIGMQVSSQRMGAEGGGSDALQKLIEAANPNVSEMNGPALREAAQAVKAQLRMTMSMDRMLPNPQNIGTTNYREAETKLAPFRDYRLWQIEHARSDAERQRILSLIPDSEQTAFRAKATRARELGLFK